MMVATGQRSGYLDVKVPAKARGKGIKAWKAWKRRWVVVHGMTNVSTRNPVVTIDMYSHETREGHQLERTTIYLERVIGIFRSLSRSHVYAFSVEGQETLLYLSGYSETDSQQWITALRCILWPPTAKPTLECSIGDVFKVSIIENLSSFVSRSRIASTVGYMITLPSVILLASLSTGSILVEWPWQYIHKAILMDVTCPEDTGKILCVEICSDVSTSGIYYFFSEKADEISRILARRIVPCQSLGSKPLSNRNSICSMRSTQTLDRPTSSSTTSNRSMKITAQRTYRKVSEDVTGSRRYTSADLSQLRYSGYHRARSAENLEQEVAQSEMDAVTTKPLKVEEISEKMAAAAAQRDDDGDATIIRQRGKRKLPVISQPLTSPLSFDNIPLRIAVAREGSIMEELARVKLDRRKSSSDSALTSPRSVSTTRSSQLQRMSALSARSGDTDNSDYEEIPVFDHGDITSVTPAEQPRQPQPRRSTDSQRHKQLSSVTPSGDILPVLPSSRPQSVYSCASQASRDSGVLSSTPEDAIQHKKNVKKKRNEILIVPASESTRVSPSTLRRMTSRSRSNSECAPPSQDSTPRGVIHDDNESRMYRKFTDFIEESTNRELENSLAQRLSSSSDSTLYSEIDVFPEGKSNQVEDPLYEDLDKFRKNIHKLLGIPHSAEHPLAAVATLRRTPSPAPLDPPPPLPPRKYSKNAPLSKQMSLQEAQPRRRKDVMKYLGVDKEKLFGSLDKLNGAGQTVVDVAQKRKDIYRYLGIPSMASSQPAGLNQAESTYDSVPTVRRQNSLLQDRIAVVPSVDTSGRRISRTFVKTGSLPHSMLPPMMEPKPTKKRRMVFLKRKTSTKKQSDKPEVAAAATSSTSTYVSYDCYSHDDWEDIRKSTEESSSAIDPIPSTVKPVEQESSKSDNPRSIRKESADMEEDMRALNCPQKMAPHPRTRHRLEQQQQNLLKIPLRTDSSDAYSVPSTLKLTTAVQLRIKDTKQILEAKQPFYVNLNELKPALKAIVEDEIPTLSDEQPDVIRLEIESSIVEKESCEGEDQSDKEVGTGFGKLLQVERETYQDVDRLSSTSSVDSNYMVMTGSARSTENSSSKVLKNWRSNSVYMELDIARDQLEREVLLTNQNADNNRSTPRQENNELDSDERPVTIIDESVVHLRKKSRSVPLICINDEEVDAPEDFDNKKQPSSSNEDEESENTVSDRLFELSMDIKLSNKATIKELKRLLPDETELVDNLEAESVEDYSGKLIETLINSIRGGAALHNEKSITTDDITPLCTDSETFISGEKANVPIPFNSLTDSLVTITAVDKDESTVSDTDTILHFITGNNPENCISKSDFDFTISGDDALIHIDPFRHSQKDIFDTIAITSDGDLLSFSDNCSVSSDSILKPDIQEDPIVDQSDQGNRDSPHAPPNERNARVNEMLRERLSLYIDQLFTESLMEFPKDSTNLHGHIGDTLELETDPDDLAFCIKESDFVEEQNAVKMKGLQGPDNPEINIEVKDNEIK